MNANEIVLLAKATQDGSMPFPEIVGKLIANGVEYYHVDYATRSFTFYSASGAAVLAPIIFEELPSISEDFMWPHSRRQFWTVNNRGKSFGLSAGVPCRLECRDIWPIFVGSEPPISAAKGINIQSGFQV